MKSFGNLMKHLKNLFYAYPDRYRAKLVITMQERRNSVKMVCTYLEEKGKYYGGRTAKG
jgi:hypothetical protein